MRAEVLVGPERRRRWTAEQKLRIVEEAFEHGVRVADVARRRDVSRAQIYQWRAELGGNDRSAEAGRDIVGFVPAPAAEIRAELGADRARGRAAAAGA